MGMSVDRLISALRDSGSWVDAQTLADLFQVTPRTVRNYVRRANTQAGTDVIESSHHGYRLVGDRTSAEPHPSSSPETTPPQKRRETRLLALLLTRTERQSIYDLAEELHVSDSTLQATLRSVRPRIVSEGLSVEHERDLVWIDGAERDKRRLIGKVIREDQVPDSPHDLIGIPTNSPLVTQEAWSHVREMLAAHKFALSDFGLGNLMVHLEIMVSRLALGSSIRSLDAADETSAYARAASDEICDWAAELLGLSIEPAERAYVALLIDANAVRRESAADDELVTPLDLRIAREAAEQLSWTYCLDEFSEDFIRRLAAHIHLLCRRARHGMEVPNPLSKRVRSDYPLIYDMAVRVANVIEQATNCVVSEDEIAFLAFHVGGYLACSSRQGRRVRYVVLYLDYHGLQGTFVDQLEEVIGRRADLVLAERVSAWQPGQVSCDLVITPARVKVPEGVRQLVMGPIFSASDGDRLLDCIDGLLQEQRSSSTATILRRFIKPDLIKFDLQVDDMEEAIHALASDSVRRGLVREGFEDEVLARERLSTTAFNNLVAIPHTLNPSAVQPFLYLLINRRPIAWGTQHVNLVILLGIPPHERESFTNLYVDLLSALINPLNVASLLESTSYEDAITRLERIVRHERRR